MAYPKSQLVAKLELEVSTSALSFTVISSWKLCVFETHFYTLGSMVIEQAVKMQGVY